MCLRKTSIYFLILIMFFSTQLFSSVNANLKNITNNNESVIKNIEYTLKQDIKNISFESVGIPVDIFEKSYIVKEQPVKSFIIHKDAAFQPNIGSIYIDTQLNSTFKVKDVKDNNNGDKKIYIETPKLNEVLNKFNIPEQVVDIKENNIIKQSLPKDVKYSTYSSNTRLNEDEHLFELNNLKIPDSNAIINGHIKLYTPKITTKFQWNKDFKVEISAGQEVDINITGEWECDSDKKVLLSGIQLPMDKIGKLYAGLYILFNANGKMSLSVDMKQDFRYRASIGGSLKYGSDPTNVITDSKVDKSINTTNNISKKLHNSYLPIEIYAGLDILGNCIEIRCKMGIDVMTKDNGKSLYIDVDGICKANAIIFEHIHPIIVQRWDILEYVTTFEHVNEISFSKYLYRLAKKKESKIEDMIWDDPNFELEIDSVNLEIDTAEANLKCKMRYKRKILGKVVTLKGNADLTFKLIVSQDYRHFGITNIKIINCTLDKYINIDTVNKVIQKVIIWFSKNVENKNKYFIFDKKIYTIYANERIIPESIKNLRLPNIIIQDGIANPKFIDIQCKKFDLEYGIVALKGIANIKYTTKEGDILYMDGFSTINLSGEFYINRIDDSFWVYIPDTIVTLSKENTEFNQLLNDFVETKLERKNTFEIGELH